MSFPNVVFGTEGAQYITNSVAVGQGVHMLGTQMIFNDGRRFRWGQQNASTAAVAGDLQQNALTTANHVLQTLSVAAAVGDGSISITIGNTAIAADEYKDGVIAIELGTGFGYLYTIKSHAAVAGNGTLAFPIKETVQVAIPTTANTVSLIRNRYKLVLVFPTTPTGSPVGFAVKPVVVSGFGWYATAGLVACTTQGTVVVGNTVVPSASTAGSVAPSVLTEGTPNTGTGIIIVLGQVVHVATTTNKSVINALLD